MKIKLLILFLSIFLTSCNCNKCDDNYEYIITYKVYYTTEHVVEYKEKSNCGFYVFSHNGSNMVKEKRTNKVIIDTTAPIEVVSSTKNKIYKY